MTQSEPLIKTHEAKARILDKAYDNDAVVKAAWRPDGQEVTPSKKSQKVPRVEDRHLYKERKLVEWIINLLKSYGRVATWYEKTDRDILGFVHAASILIPWL